MAKKTRITLYLDPAIVDRFRAQAAGTETGYQTLINAALRQLLDPDTAPITMSSLRQVLREEIHRYSRARRHRVALR
jgi:hypothetical protein